MEKAGRETVLTPQFSVEDEFSDGTVHHPTIQSEPSSGFSPKPAEPVSPAGSIPSGGGITSTPPHTPLGSVVGSAPHIQWATPPSDASSGLDEAPRRYKTIPDLLDSTDKVQSFEYSGICLAASDEPASVEDALSEDCWRQAMRSEMQAIEENRTWVVSDLPAKQKAIGLK